MEKNNLAEQYQEKGFLVIENVLSKKQIDELKNRISEFENYKNLQNVICEDTEIRSIFSPHKIFDEFEVLYKNKTLTDITSKLLKEQFYLYQYKVNLKKPFVGKWWEWHQDFIYWNYDDGIELPNMVSIMIYLDDTTNAQGPLMVIPGSHKNGIVRIEPKNVNGNLLINSLNSNLKYTVAKDIIRKSANEQGIESLEYKAGTAIFFHPNIFHASSGNLSPFTRDTVIITYNLLNNAPKEFKRPDFICLREFISIGNNTNAANLQK